MAVRELDPKKKEIIEHVDGPWLVIAGPGAGKTMGKRAAEEAKAKFIRNAFCIARCSR